MYYQEYLLKISGQSDHSLRSSGLKCVSLSAPALVTVTGGPFDVYDVTSNSYNVFPPLVVQMDYQWREIFYLRGCNSVMGDPIDLKFSGGMLGTGILARGLLEMCMIHFRGKLYVMKLPETFLKECCL